MRAVVGGEDEHRVVGNTQRVEQLHHVAHIAVEASHHRRERCQGSRRSSIGTATIRVFGGIRHLVGFGNQAAVHVIDAVVRQNQLGMRQRIAEEGEERLVGMLANELECLLMDGVGRIGDFALLVVLRQVDTRFVVPQMVGIIVVGQRLAVVAEELVEAHLCGIGHRAGITQAPLAEASGGIALLLQHRRHGERAFGHRHLAFGIHALVAANEGMPRMQTGHQRASRRSRHSSSGISLREAQALLLQSVEVGGLNQFLSIRLDVADAKVVGQDIDDVGMCGCFILGLLAAATGERSHGSNEAAAGGEEVFHFIRDIKRYLGKLRDIKGRYLRLIEILRDIGDIKGYLGTNVQLTINN